MTLAELRTLLIATGYPVAYSHFKKPPKPPYLVYLFAYDNDLIADNQNYAEISHIQVELYTVDKDEVAESKVQAVLKDAHIPYEKTEELLESEDLFQVVYDIEIVGG